MELTIDKLPAALVLRVAGEITIDNAQDLKEQAKSILDDMDQPLLIMDMERITFIDSSGIGFLIVLKARCEDKGKSLVLLRPSQQAAKILRLVQLDALFRIADSESQAMDPA